MAKDVIKKELNAIEGLETSEKKPNHSNLGNPQKARVNLSIKK